MNSQVVLRVNRFPGRRRGLSALPIATLLLIAGGGPVAAETNVSLDYGMGVSSEGSWRGLDAEVTEGVRLDYARPGWPVRLAVGLHTTRAEITESEFVPDGGVSCIIPLVLCWQTGNTVTRTIGREALEQFSAGVDKVWGGDASRVQAFAGGGLAFVRASSEDFVAGISERDTSPGLWTHAGIALVSRPFRGRVRIRYGADLSVLGATRFDFAGGERTGDSVRVNLFFGLGWR